MSTARELLANKGGHIYSISPQASVLDAAILMNEHKIGCLVVIGDEQVVGILSERDVLMRVVAQRLDPARALVGDAMTGEVVCCAPDASIDEIRSVFRARRIRHLPVVDEHGRLLGLISIGDLNALDADMQEQHIHFLKEYIQGRS